MVTVTAEETGPRHTEATAIGAETRDARRKIASVGTFATAAISATIGITAVAIETETMIATAGTTIGRTGEETTGTMIL